MTPSNLLLGRAWTLATLVVGVLALLPGASAATPILDQSSAQNLLTGGYKSAHPTGYVVTEEDDVPFQSFLVGHSGQLTEIDLLRVQGSFSGPLYGDADSCCNLYLYDGLAYSTNLALGIAVDAPQLAVVDGEYVSDPEYGPVAPLGWDRFILSNPIPVTAGDILTFALGQSGATAWATAFYDSGSLALDCLQSSCDDPLVEGRRLLNAPVWLLPEWDLAFRTYVNTPEPSLAWLLGLVALSVVSARLRGRD